MVSTLLVQDVQDEHPEGCKDQERSPDRLSLAGEDSPPKRSTTEGRMVEKRSQKSIPIKEEAEIADRRTVLEGYSRKNKSLGLLSRNFVTMLGDETGMDVSLDDAARKLGVERRRVYDIVNVLESVGVMVRKAKSQYVWFGPMRLEETLASLKTQALREIAEAGQGSQVTESNSPRRSTSPQSSQSSSNPPLCKTECLTPPENSDLVMALPDNRREGSLANLSVRFVKLFLVAKDSVVSLDTAASSLKEPCYPGEDQRTKNKTKIRRLYDIANILSSLKLIKKMHTSSKRPAFCWLGPNAQDADESEKEVDEHGRKRPSPHRSATPESEDKQEQCAEQEQSTRNSSLLKSQQLPLPQQKRARQDRQPSEQEASSATKRTKRSNGTRNSRNSSRKQTAQSSSSKEAHKQNAKEDILSHPVESASSAPPTASATTGFVDNSSATASHFEQPAAAQQQSDPLSRTQAWMEQWRNWNTWIANSLYHVPAGPPPMPPGMGLGIPMHDSPPALSDLRSLQSQPHRFASALSMLANAGAVGAPFRNAQVCATPTGAPPGLGGAMFPPAPPMASATDAPPQQHIPMYQNSYAHAIATAAVAAALGAHHPPQPPTPFASQTSPPRTSARAETGAFPLMFPFSVPVPAFQDTVLSTLSMLEPTSVAESISAKELSAAAAVASLASTLPGGLAQANE